MPKNNIEIIGKNKWRYRITVNGKRKEITSWKNESKAAFSTRCDELDKMSDASAGVDTLNDLFDLWMENHVLLTLGAGSARVTANTYDLYIRHSLGRKKIIEIKRIDVYSLLSKASKKGKSGKELSPEYLKKIRGCISRPYNWAIDTLGYNLVSPTQGLIFKPKTAKPKTKKQRVISEEDMSRILISATKSKYNNYFLLLSKTGLRPSECLGLQIRDIKAEHLEIRRAVTGDGLSSLKTPSSRRDIPLTPELKRILKDQSEKTLFKSKEGWLFPSVKDDRVPQMSSVSSALKSTLKRTAVWERGGRNGLKKIRLITPPVKCTLYDFRHTFATRMAERGMSQIALQTIMGHSDITTTLEYYVDLTEKMIEEARILMAM